MKKFILSIYGFMLSVVVFAQSINVFEGTESFSVGKQNAVVATFKHSDKDKVEKEWKDLIKEFKPDNVSYKKHEYFFDNVKFTTVSSNTIDVYSIILANEKEGEIRLMACFDLGGAYATSSSHSKEMSYFKVIMRDFAIKMAKEELEHQIKEATKTLNKTTDKRTDLEKDNKGLEQDISDYKEKIKKAENKIEENKKEIEFKKKEEATQQKTVEELKAKMAEVK